MSPSPPAATTPRFYDRSRYSVCVCTRVYACLIVRRVEGRPKLFPSPPPPPPPNRQCTRDCRAFLVGFEPCSREGHPVKSFFSFFHYYQDNTRIWPHTLRRTVFHCRVPFAFCYLFSVSRESSYRCRVTSVASVSRLATRWTNHRYRHGKQKTQRKKKVTRTFYNNTYGLIVWGPIMQCRAREWIFSYGLP